MQIAKKQEEVEVEIKQIKATCNDILQRIETTKGNRDINQYKVTACKATLAKFQPVTKTP